MKTGNSILAVFFWFMSLCVPCGIVVIPELERFKFLKQYIPTGLTTIEISIIVFMVFIALGCASAIFGMERKAKSITMETKDNRLDIF